jgi:hypothetical protein
MLCWFAFTLWLSLLKIYLLCIYLPFILLLKIVQFNCPFIDWIFLFVGYLIFYIFWTLFLYLMNNIQSSLLLCGLFLDSHNFSLDVQLFNLMQSYVSTLDLIFWAFADLHSESSCLCLYFQVFSSGV